MRDWTSGSTALFTDLYELTMMQAYHAEGMVERAVFSLFVRRLPDTRNYLLACGLEAVLDYLENLNFQEEDVDYLASLEIFSAEFLKSLKAFRFTGDVYAIAEGTPVFANEPILEIEAPIAEAQVVETFAMNQIHHQTLAASKAARVVEAAEGRTVVDFGARRMHGLDAAMKAARAFHIAGVASTSNVLAGRTYGLPVAGTMAHSYIQAHGDEPEAFRAFARTFPETVLLVDTYDTIEGVRRVIDLARLLGEDFKVSAIRLDSGDLLQLSLEARRMLDEAGLKSVGIFASGGLDEYEVAALVCANAPISGFGVGTNMGVSGDAPDLDIAYKLCEYAGEGRVKLSPGKPVLPGRKQVFRVERDGFARKDVIARADEKLEGRPLLRCVMRNGRRTAAGTVPLEECREVAKAGVAALPAHIRAIEEAAPPYAVEVSGALDRYHDEVAARFSTT